MSEKVSGKTSKSRRPLNDKNIENKKNAQSKAKILLEKKLKASTARKKSKVTKKTSKATKRVSKEATQVINEGVNNSAFGVLKDNKSTSKIAKKISSDLEVKPSESKKPKVNRNLEKVTQKKSGKTATSGKPPNDKNIENKKNAQSKVKILLERNLKASTARKKYKVTKKASKETAQVITEGKDNSALGVLKDNKFTSKIVGKISSDLSRKDANHLKPYNTSILFLTERHKAITNDVVSCLKSNAPFCFLESDLASYQEYYKEIVINHLKDKEEIELLYFDPKFGDDLSAIINRELEGIDISLIGALKSSISRKILIIDNENFANNLDWELVDSLRLELKAANLGVFGVAPTFLRDKAKAISVASNFKVFFVSKIKKSELKELNKYVSNHPDKAKHIETLNSLSMNEPEKNLSDRKPASGESFGFWHKLRKYILRK